MGQFLHAQVSECRRSPGELGFDAGEQAGAGMCLQAGFFQRSGSPLQWANCLPAARKNAGISSGNRSAAASAMLSCPLTHHAGARLRAPARKTVIAVRYLCIPRRPPEVSPASDGVMTSPDLSAMQRIGGVDYWQTVFPSRTAIPCRPVLSMARMMDRERREAPARLRRRRRGMPCGG